MPERPVYLDNHATTRTDPRVVEAMLPYFTEKYGNAASYQHSFGEEAALAVEQARHQVADLLGTPAETVIFTSGATEANNLVLKGLISPARNRVHLVVNAVEHRSILDPAKRLQRQGADVTVLPVDRYGRVNPQQVADAIRDETVLVSVMCANNEVGTLNPIAEIGSVCRERGVLLHCDAVQAAGKVPLNLQQLPIDLLSVSAHKFHGPKGCGALFVRKEMPRIYLEPLIDGGGQEGRMRSGTLPVPLIVGFGKACELARQSMQQESPQIAGLRDRLWRGLQSELDGIVLNGHPQEHLPGNLNVSFAGVDGDALMMSLKEIAVSSGSACSATNPRPSHVLHGMGIPEDLCRASLRFGISRFNTADEIDFAAGYVGQTVRRLRSLVRG